MLKIQLIGSLVTAATLAGCNAAAADPLPSDEAEFGAQYVIYDLTRIRSPSIRARRASCDSCSGEGAAIEVTIGLLGIGGEATTASLLNLLAVQLDAGGAEAQSCQIAKRGKPLVPALQHLDAGEAATWCQETFNRLRQRELSGVNDVSVDEICRPVDEIEQDRVGWIAALESEQDLFAESGPC